MGSINLFLFFVPLIAAVAVQGQSVSQRAVLYDQSNGQGNYIVIPEDYAEDLSAAGFDNRVRSVCVTGIWLFYQNPNYNTDGVSGMEYVFGRDNYCVNIRTIAGLISSVRYAGAPRDYRISTFTLYESDYFQGREEYTLTDLPNLNLAGNHQSIIITGDDNWQIFDQPQYSGNSICLRPPEPGTNTPSFISDITNISGKIPYGSIRSVRKGCQSGTVDKSVTLSSFARMNTDESFVPLQLV